MKNKDLKSNNLTYIINEIEYTINKLVLKHSSLKPKFKSKSKSKIDPVTSLDKMIEKSVVKIKLILGDQYKLNFLKKYILEIGNEIFGYILLSSLLT